MKEALMVAMGCLALAATPKIQSQTIATFDTSVGTIEVELFDDKPVTTANFIKYANSGVWNNMFVQRWETNFVIQGGGYYVQEVDGQKAIARVNPHPPIVNEYSVGREVSNTFGTIAMARQAGVVNSATSQWFFNLKDNSFLDEVDEGFTVFGNTISGHNVLQRFIPPVGSQGIYRVSVRNDGGLTTVPVLEPSPGYDDLIYVHLSFRRNIKQRLSVIRGGTRQLVFEAIPGQTNIVELSTVIPPVWTPLTNYIPPTTNGVALNRSAPAPLELYRVRVDF